MQKGKELNDFQRNPLDIEILSNLRFGSLEIGDTSVTRVTNKNGSSLNLSRLKRRRSSYVCLVGVVTNGRHLLGLPFR